MAYPTTMLDRRRALRRFYLARVRIDDDSEGFPERSGSDAVSNGVVAKLARCDGNELPHESDAIRPVTLSIKRRLYL